MAEPGHGAGSAGGKLILCGEHAVVYGHPAIALGVDRTTTVHLRRVDGPTRVTEPHPDDPRLLRAVRAVVGDGWEVTIRSELPIGRGMGSSAALAVALVRALAAAEGRAAGEHEVHGRAFACERVFHGNPSGIDHAVAARGGVVWYRKTPDGPALTDLPVPDWSLAVLDSGSAGNTADLVASVAARMPSVAPLLDRIGALVARARDALSDVDTLGPMLTENHRLLAEIGVSTPGLDRLVGLALSAGATGAKLAGAGGGGVVIALGRDPSRVVDEASRHGVAGFVCRPGARP